MLPLECQYLNKNALTTLAGPLTPPVKHFQLKRKPKSATLRAELLQKCECPVPAATLPAPGASQPGSPAAELVCICLTSVLRIRGCVFKAVGCCAKFSGFLEMYPLVCPAVP